MLANRDPIANIMGPAYAGSVDLVQVHSQLTRDRDSAGKNKEGDEAAFRLLLLLHSMDIKLMKNSVQQLAKLVWLWCMCPSADVVSGKSA